MKLLALVLAAALAAPSFAQEKKKAPPKKPAAQSAHQKASPEQIRKFNELAKKQQQKL